MFGFSMDKNIDWYSVILGLMITVQQQQPKGADLAYSDQGSEY
jgi:hypothetical protein